MYHHELIDTSQNDFPFMLILHHNKPLVTSIAPHWHRSLEISYTHSGSIDNFTINGESFKTTSGDILIINPNDVHSIESPHYLQENNIALTILFPYEFLEKEISHYPLRCFQQPKATHLSDCQKEAVAQCQNELAEVTSLLLFPSELSKLMIMAHIYHFLYLITDNFSTIESTPHTWKSKKDFYKMTDIITYIDETYLDPLTLASLAETFHMSDGYFSRFFKKYMGISVMAYVQEVRLKHSLQLLLNTDLSLEIISDTSGFSHPKAFSRAFKKKYSQTPSVYRHQQNKS